MKTIGYVHTWCWCYALSFGTPSFSEVSNPELRQVQLSWRQLAGNAGVLLESASPGGDSPIKMTEVLVGNFEKNS